MVCTASTSHSSSLLGFWAYFKPTILACLCKKLLGQPTEMEMSPMEMSSRSARGAAGNCGCNSERHEGFLIKTPDHIDNGQKDPYQSGNWLTIGYWLIICHIVTLTQQNCCHTSAGSLHHLPHSLSAAAVRRVWVWRSLQTIP